MEGVVGAAARGTVMTMEDCDAIEVARRDAIERQGAGTAYPKAHLYAAEEDGGEGSMHTYQVATASWMSTIDNMLSAPEGRPAGMVARYALARTAWRLGCRGKHPLEWDTTFIPDEQLNEGNLMEAYYLQRNRAGLRGMRTSMQMKDGLDDDLWEMTGQQETVRGPRLWEDSMTMWRRGARRCTYKKRLAEVGLVWWSDVTNEKGDGWMTWTEASRVHELRGKTDKEDYEQLLGELNGQPEATTAQWFAGRHERWDEAGLEWNRSDQRIAIRIAAEASTEQRGVRNGQVKGEDKWTYERIDGARRTGETGEDATERWEY